MPLDLFLESVTDSDPTNASDFGEDLTTANILVVDYSPAARTVLAHHLRHNGFNNVTLVEDGNQALDVIKSIKPELIITNLLMPGMDGFELCRYLRADPENRDVPILAQIAMTDLDLRAQAFASGATDLLTIPYDPRELLSRLHVLLERGRLIDRLSEFQRRIADEFMRAAAIQESLLPSHENLARLKSLYAIDVASHYEASVGLGGDIWGIEPLGNEEVLVFCADFVGHGLGAALNTVRLHSFINSNSQKPRTPAALLTQLNRFLCDVLPVGQFATMFCAAIDFRNWIIEYSSAAAPPQLLKSAGNRPFEIIEQPGFPLGVTRNADYENFTAPFAPGGMLLLFSDALIETPSLLESAFTPSTLRNFVDTIPANSGPTRLCEQVISELFSRISESPGDDLTLIGVEYACEEGPQ